MTDRPLRVVQIVTTLARGGAQATVLSSLDMEDDGIEVSVLAGGDDTGEGSYWAELSGRAGVIPHLHRRIDPVADGRAVLWLRGWLRRERPDVVHTHSSKAGVVGRVAARLAGVPAVHTVHGWSFAPRAAGGGPGGGRLGAGARAVVGLERAMAGWSRTLVVVTPLDATTGLDVGIGRPDQYQLIRSGIDLSVPRRGRDDRARIRAELGLDDRFVVGTVGRLTDQKDPATLLVGFARALLHDGLLLLVGDGPLRAGLEQQARSLGVADRVRFLGQRNDAARLVAAFDQFVLTSRWEGLPRALIEAMAAGVPVIATPAGGVPEVVRRGATGVLVPMADPGAVAEALRSRYHNPARHLGMARSAEAATAPFSVETMRADLRDLWRETAGANRPVIPAG